MSEDENGSDSKTVMPIKVVSSTGLPLSYIIRAGAEPNQTEFITPPETNLQVGFVVYPAKGEIQRHVHRPLERRLIGTSEVLLVKSGRCEVDIYDDDRNFVETYELSTGDVLLMVGGGHGFRMLEHTILLEVKQGPYLTPNEKETF